MNTSVWDGSGNKILVADELDTTIVRNTVAQEVARETKRLIRQKDNERYPKDARSRPVVVVDERGDSFLFRVSMIKVSV